MASIRRVRRARRPFSLLAGGKRTPATFGKVRNSLGQAIGQLECHRGDMFLGIFCSGREVGSRF